MKARYKTPSRRRIKKWQKRASRLACRAGVRGFGWFFQGLLRIAPMHTAAKRAGFSLTAGAIDRLRAEYGVPQAIYSELPLRRESGFGQFVDLRGLRVVNEILLLAVAANRGLILDGSCNEPNAGDVRTP